jgi:hypothetical protein
VIDLKKLLAEEDNMQDCPLEIQAALSILALNVAMEHVLDTLTKLDNRLKMVEKVLRHQ